MKILLHVIHHFYCLCPLFLLTEGGQRSTECVAETHPVPWLFNLLYCLHEEPRFNRIEELPPVNWKIDETKATEIKEILQANANKSFPVYKTVAEKIESVGYKVEIHKITTADGYILTYYRIPHAKSTGSTKKPGPPVLIQHGLFAHSGTWLTQKEENNLPYILSNLGYDVWLGNARGTVVSQSHVNMTTDDPDFWDFSWQEMAYYDIPAAIDHILATSGLEKLFYIGHSMGTTMFFVAMSLRPEYNQKIRLMTGYAAVTQIFHMTSPARVFGPLGYLPFTSMYKRQVLPSEVLESINPMLDRFCDPILITSNICTNVLFLLSGFDYKQANLTQLPEFLKSSVSPTSFKTMQHFTQGMIWNSFRHYNYGKVTNCGSYGTCLPPHYDLAKVTCPVALFFGLNDLLVNMQDSVRLSHSLSNVVLNHTVPFDDWSHMDFLTAIQVREFVYDPTIDLMQRF